MQNVSGGIAADSWSSITPGTPGSPTPLHTFVDDVEVHRLCNPLAGVAAASTVSESFQFTEGPLWMPETSSWLFTDITTGVIHEYTPGNGTIATFRSPSDRANGLARDVSGELLAAEHETRRLSRTDSGGIVTTVVGQYMGMQFNSPNDLSVRSDGTIYFTDPDYGMSNPALREIPFNGLYRLAPGGTLTAEWAGTQGASGPNGVVLSPDESVLYMADSHVGQVYAWDVNPDGSLTNQRSFASGLYIPDGMCIDTRGNLYVATWSNSVEVYDPDGLRWGSIALPRQATNCAFGGSDATSLLITAHEGVYAAAMTIAGVP